MTVEILSPCLLLPSRPPPSKHSLIKHWNSYSQKNYANADYINQGVAVAVFSPSDASCASSLTVVCRFDGSFFKLSVSVLNIPYTTDCCPSGLPDFAVIISSLLHWRLRHCGTQYGWHLWLCRNALLHYAIQQFNFHGMMSISIEKSCLASW